MPKPSVSSSAKTAEPQQARRQRQRVSVTRRIVIADVQPHVENGRYPVRRIVGDTATVSAEVLCDGGATLRACILYRPPGESRWRPAPMQPDEITSPENRLALKAGAPHRWRGLLRLQHGGMTQFCIEAWIDVFATWVSTAQGAAAKQESAALDAELVADGQRILDSAMTRAAGADLKLLAECRESLQEHARSTESMQRWFRNRDLHKRMLVHGERRHVVRSEPVLSIEAARRRAVFVTGYHASDSDKMTEQTTREIRQMGAEFVRVPAGAAPVEWPSGIDRAEALTLPRSPVADWLHQHPQWYSSSPLAGGNSAVALLDFWCEQRDALWDACLASMQARVRQGVSVFVATQPAQVPFPFWEWVIRRIRELHPEVLFISGPVAGSRARALSRVGFSQVQVAWEASLQQALKGVEDLQRCRDDEWRPFVEVPATAPKAAVAAELPLVQLLAATACASFGIRGALQKPTDLAWLRLLNQLRQDNRALQINGNLQLLSVTSQSVMAFHRTAPQGRNDVIVIVNRNPQESSEAQVRLPEIHQEAHDERSIELEDLLDGQRYTWNVGDNYVRLGPGLRQAHVLRVVRRSRLFG